MTDLKTKLDDGAQQALRSALRYAASYSVISSAQEHALLAAMNTRTLLAEPDAAMVERAARAIDDTYDVDPYGVRVTNLADVATAASRAVLDHIEETGRG